MIIQNHVEIYLIHTENKKRKNTIKHKHSQLKPKSNEKS